GRELARTRALRGAGAGDALGRDGPAPGPAGHGGRLRRRAAGGPAATRGARLRRPRLHPVLRQEPPAPGVVHPRLRQPGAGRAPPRPPAVLTARRDLPAAGRTAATGRRREAGPRRRGGTRARPANVTSGRWRRRTGRARNPAAARL